MLSGGWGGGSAGTSLELRRVVLTLGVCSVHNGHHAGWLKGFLIQSGSLSQALDVGGRNSCTRCAEHASHARSHFYCSTRAALAFSERLPTVREINNEMENGIVECDKLVLIYEWPAGGGLLPSIPARKKHFY